jgi:type IV pilus assembly protein PilW
MMYAPRREAGFSIIELMISITLGLVILAALTAFFVSTSANRHEMERSTRQIENGRYAIDTLREDIVLAGYYADMQPLAIPTWTTNPVCPATIADLGFAASPAYTAPLPVWGYADGVGVPGCITDLAPNTDVLVVHRFNSEPVTPAQAAAGTPSGHPASGQWYIQVSQCVEDATPPGPFIVAAGNGTFNLKNHNCAAAADVWRLREEVYYVRTCSFTCPPLAPADFLPTLVRKELNVGGGATMEDQPLVEGIQGFRVDYGIDNTNDGLADVWKRCDVATPCTTAEWGNVVAAKLYVLSRNAESSPGYVDSKTYSMGLSGTVGPFNDGFKRHVYTAQVNIPNRTGPREPQLDGKAALIP